MLFYLSWGNQSVGYYSDFVCHCLPLADARGNAVGGQRLFCVVVRVAPSDKNMINQMNRLPLSPLEEGKKSYLG